MSVVAPQVASVVAVYAVPSRTCTLLTMRIGRHLETVLCYRISLSYVHCLQRKKDPSRDHLRIVWISLQNSVCAFISHSSTSDPSQLLHLFLLPVELALRVSQVLFAGLRAAPNSVLSTNGLESIVEDPLRCDLHRLVEHVG